ncbi:hypothetical protein KP509_30G028700 [Ceratopteris richardii]|uniref:Protein kinase domain-containing protein n=1 Tax=Ceratopteris richardii TaxID=49495 RepID=A0A8T2R2R0_CERRI|nr:hypothetical protein KP509_30G028700 [Ceratopteris richardii]
MLTMKPLTFFLAFSAILVLPTSSITNEDDVFALNVLFTAMGAAPTLDGWSGQGGDPCSDNWKGIVCVGPNITELNLSGLNLMGTLGYALDKLRSLMILDLSNNQIKGSLPFQLPLNIQKLLLANNQLIGVLPYSLTYMSKLTDLNISNNELNGNIPDVFQTSLTDLDLSYNNLTGPLPRSFAALSKLSTLHLQKNHLVGNIYILSDLPLKDLDLSNNNFTGDIPPKLSSLPSSGYLGNGFNISSGTISALPPSPSPSGAESIVPMGAIIQEPLIGSADSEQGLSGGYIAGIVAALMIIILVAITVILFFMWKSKELAIKSKDACFLQGYLINTNTKFKHRSISDTATMKYMIPKGQKARDVDKTINSGISATIFNFGELQAGTNNFSQEKLIGEGASARVYKGTLKSGKVMAIKNIDTSAHMVPDKEFFDVLMGISRLRHANVVELVGYCTENGHRMLVYEYIDNGTLHEALHSEEDKNKLLTWNIRIKIALGAARALEYLHEICEPMVVHCNFKSSNILLDEDFTPRLSDCGLFALTYFGSQCQLPEQHVGSFGYSAPEFALSGVFSAKSDVYSFGVVMLELLTGRKPLDSSRPRAEQSLVCWAAPQLNDIDALSKIVDPSLKGIYPAKSLARFADVVALCVQAESDLRPPMSEVVQSLVHLVQRASVTRRQSGDELGLSQRYMERQDVGSE